MILDFQSSGAVAFLEDFSVVITEFDLPDEATRRIEFTGDDRRSVFSAS